MSAQLPEPSPVRDNGPYLTDEQARAQWEATRYGMPTPSVRYGKAWTAEVITEALLGTGVEVSDNERAHIMQLGETMSPETCQIINGWIMRSHLSGRKGPTAK